jgi:hypothetical protein
MARPRKPTAILELSGAFKHDPQRARGDEPQPTGGLGAPPEYMKQTERAAWRELAEVASPGVLTNADRWLVELACRLMARLRDPGTHLSTGESNQLLLCLTRMGMTPADRNRIHVDPAKTEDPMEQFLREAPKLGPR